MLCETRKFMMVAKYLIIASELVKRTSSPLWRLVSSDEATIGDVAAYCLRHNVSGDSPMDTPSSNQPENSGKQFFEVTPLNSVPYIGPPLPHSYTPSQSTQDFEDGEKGRPAMVYFPCASQKEWNDILAATKIGIAFTGTAAMGKVGPSVGLIDIGESEDSYFFRVSLPGVAREDKGFSCDVDPDGKITIRGVTTTGEKTVCRNAQVFQMQTRNLCRAGHFSVSFHLPGPVNENKFSGVFEADGILEGIVKKR